MHCYSKSDTARDAAKDLLWSFSRTHVAGLHQPNSHATLPFLLSQLTRLRDRPENRRAHKHKSQRQTCKHSTQIDTDPPRNTQNPYTYKAHTAQTADTLYTAHTTHKHTTLHPHDTQHTHSVQHTRLRPHTHRTTHNTSRWYMANLSPAEMTSWSCSTACWILCLPCSRLEQKGQA